MLGPWLAETNGSTPGSAGGLLSASAPLDERIWSEGAKGGRCFSDAPSQFKRISASFAPSPGPQAPPLTGGPAALSLSSLLCSFCCRPSHHDDGSEIAQHLLQSETRQWLNKAFRRFHG